MSPAEPAEKIAGMLRGMGLDARVHDPSDAAEVGPKIAAVMSERKA